MDMDGSGQFDPRLITKLVKNFRSHTELLTVPNQLFYDNELESCADPLSLTHDYTYLIFFHILILDCDRELSNFPGYSK